MFCSFVVVGIELCRLLRLIKGQLLLLLARCSTGWVVQEIELNLEGQCKLRKLSRIPWMSPINYSFRTLSSSYLNMSICVATDISTVILLWCIPLTDLYGYYWHYPFFLVGAPLINHGLPTMQIKNSQNYFCP